MLEYYYAMVSDHKELEKMKDHYHCVILASSKEEARARLNEFSNIYIFTLQLVSKFFSHKGYDHEITSLLQKVNRQNPIMFSRPIAFFKASSTDQDENQAVKIIKENLKDQDFFEAGRQILIQESHEEYDYLIINSFESNAFELLDHFGHRMHRVLFGSDAINLKYSALYLLEGKDIKIFLNEIILENSIHKNEEKNLNSFTLFKTNLKRKEFIKHLQQFTKAITEEERKIVFHLVLGNHQFLQQWLIKSDIHTKSSFMKPINEIIIPSAEDQSIIKILKDKEHEIKEPTLPTKDGIYLIEEEFIEILIN